jgi:hypothetical protein
MALNGRKIERYRNHRARRIDQQCDVHYLSMALANSGQIDTKYLPHSMLCEIAAFERLLQQYDLKQYPYRETAAFAKQQAPYCGSQISN